MSVENKNHKKALRVVAPTAFALGVVAAGAVSLEANSGTNKPPQPAAEIGKPYNVPSGSGEIWTPAQIKAAEAQAESRTLSDLAHKQPVNFVSGIAHVNQGDVDYFVVNPLITEQNGINLIGFFTNYQQNPGQPNSVSYVVANTVVDWAPDQYNPDELKTGYSYQVVFPTNKESAAGLTFDLNNPLDVNNSPVLDVDNNPLAIGAKENSSTPPVTVPDQGVSATQFN